MQVGGVDPTDGKLALVIGSGTTTTHGSAIIPYDTWFHVGLTADPRANTATLETSAGLTIVATGTAPPPVPSPAVAHDSTSGWNRAAPTVTPTALVLQADNVVGYVE